MKTFEVTYNDKDEHGVRRTQLINARDLNHGYGKYIFQAGPVSSLTGEGTERVALIPEANVYSIVEVQDERQC